MNVELDTRRLRVCSSIVVNILQSLSFLPFRLFVVRLSEWLFASLGRRDHLLEVLRIPLILIKLFLFKLFR